MIVEVKDLVVEYDIGNSQFTAVDIPAWSLDKGAQVAIFGPSGCGKSTLLHVLAGLLAPKSGKVNVCGQNLGQLSESDLDHFRARHIGYIFQDFNLLQGYTAVENVLLGMAFSRQKPDRRHAVELLARVGLSHREKHRPPELSIGERQRVAIARALARKPELILADEPTGSLDPVHAREVVKLLREACREHGCSLVVVSHDPGVVDSFDSSVAFMKLNRAFSACGVGVSPARDEGILPSCAAGVPPASLAVSSSAAREQQQKQLDADKMSTAHEGETPSTHPDKMSAPQQHGGAA